jgi:hypothetical protein
MAERRGKTQPRAMKSALESSLSDSQKRSSFLRMQAFDVAKDESFLILHGQRG